MIKYRRRSRDCWRLFTPLALLLLVGTVGVLYGQEQVSVTINEVDNSRFPETIAYVTVSDGRGRAIADLPSGAFMASEDGMPVGNPSLDSLENMGEPILLALAIDSSGSMGGLPLTDTKAAAAQLVNDLGPADMAALLSFSDVVVTQQVLTTDRTAVVNAMEELTAAGDTALYDAIHQGSELLASLPRGRKALVVLTDGQDTASALTLEDAVASAQQASIPIYLIGFGPSIQPDVLERVAMLTGGQFFQSPSSAEVGESFVEVARLLRYQYVLQFQSSLPADDALHTLHVTVDVQGVQASADAEFVAARGTVTVEMVSPVTGETVGGIVTLKPRIDAPGEVLQVDYLLDGNSLATVSTGDLAYEWDATAVPLGSHRLTARATDSAGNIGETEIEITLAEPITVAFAAPSGLDPVRGQVPIEFAVTSLAGVAQLELALDGMALGSAVAPPWTFAWDTAAVATGPHTLTATVYDLAGRSEEVELEIWVGVFIHLPSPEEGATVGGIITLDPVIRGPDRILQVDYALDGDLLKTVTGDSYAFQWDATAVPYGEHTLTIRATDAAGNSDEYQRALVFDEAITIEFTSPRAGDLERLGGEVLVEVDASALAGLERVEFLLDGDLMMTFQSAPFRHTWDTATAATGPHTWTATAYDANGLSNQADMDAWVGIRGSGWGIGLIIALLAVGIGVMLPLATRKRRRMIGPVSVRPSAAPQARVERYPTEELPVEPIAWLEVVEGPDAVQRWPLRPGEIVVGRSRSDCDIVVQASAASRRHAVISVEDGRCTYVDIDTKNPTLVNDVELIGAHELSEGDRIQIGETVLRFSKE